MIYTNYYLCECGAEWNNEDDCMCNDRCPQCRTEMTPYASDSGLMTQEEIATERLRAIGRRADADQVRQ